MPSLRDSALAFMVAVSPCIAIWFIMMVSWIMPIWVRSCHCGAHWWMRRWYFFWRHLDASPFNDQLQNKWTIWTFEFRRALKLTAADMAHMGFPAGLPKATWARSKWQLSPRSESYCARCVRHLL